MSQNVIITKERYKKLRLAEEKLLFLEAGGVDNWDNYGDSLHPEGEEDITQAEERINREVDAMP